MANDQSPTADDPEKAPVPFDVGRADSLTAQRLQELQQQWLLEIAAAPSPDEVGKLRARLLGRSGAMRDVASAIGRADPAERRDSAAHSTRRGAVSKTPLRPARPHSPPRRTAEKPGFDFSLPGRQAPRGRLHPLTQTDRGDQGHPYPPRVRGRLRPRGRARLL